MAKKKQRISKTELFIWKFIGLLFVVTWIAAAIGTFMLVNQYGRDDLGVGFIVFFGLLGLVSISYVALYISLFRLRPGGTKGAIGLTMIAVLSLPLTVLASNYIANTSSGDPRALLFPVGLAIGFADFILFKKLRP